MPQESIDWTAIDADPRFRELRRKKAVFLGTLMALSIVYYFMLPVGAAWFPEIFRIKVYGVVNVGLAFALSEFLFAWAVAAFYTRRANHRFDRLAEEIGRDAVERHFAESRL